MEKIPADYKPDNRIYEMAMEHEIPIAFVDKQIKPFIFHWQEKGHRRKSWHLSFWNWVKNGWKWKKEAAQKQVRTSPASNKEWQGEKIQKADPQKAREALRQLGLRKYR